jgi:hypothetical protein
MPPDGRARPYRMHSVKAMDGMMAKVEELMEVQSMDEKLGATPAPQSSDLEGTSSQASMTNHLCLSTPFTPPAKRLGSRSC